MTELVIAKVTGATSLFSAASSFYFAMTDAVSISIISSAATVLIAGVSGYFAYRAKVLASEAKEVSKETHKIVNSENEKWKEMAEKLFRAEGAKQEKADEKIRKADAEIAHAKGVTEGQHKIVPSEPT